MNKKTFALITEAIANLEETVSYGDIEGLITLLVVNNDVNVVESKFQNLFAKEGYDCVVRLTESPYVKIITPFSTNSNMLLERQVRRLNIKTLDISPSGIVFLYTNLENVFSLDTINVGLIARDLLADKEFTNVNEVEDYILTNILFSEKYIEQVYVIKDWVLELFSKLKAILKDNSHEEKFEEVEVEEEAEEENI